MTRWTDDELRMGARRPVVATIAASAGWKRPSFLQALGMTLGRFRTWLLPAVVLAALSAPAHAAAMARIQAEALVKGDAVRLGDMAKITGDAATRAKLSQVEVGPSPLPGYSRSISLDYVRIRLRQRNLDPALISADSAAQCKVTRSSQTVGADRLVEAARAFVEGSMEAGDGRVVVEPSSRPRDLTLPDGRLELTAADAGTPTGAFRRIAIRAMVEGEEAGRVDVSLRVRRYSNVAVAKRTIPRGESVVADAVTYEERDLTSLPEDALTEATALNGLQATQPIAAGSVLTARAAAEPPLVHRGDSVTIVARIGSIEVSASGVAGEDGRLGQSIRVKNGLQETRATVVDARTVEAAL
ncbi:MAG TPA: flagellar basal body P-ring formation chaperone FlgA [Armatimonadota bacterium]|jgi:flagella basal body P-ring formation protein FlgA